MHDHPSPEILLADYPPTLREVAEALRAVVRDAVPEAIEKVRPGWRLIGYDVPIGRRTAFFAWIWPEKGHVHLGFPQGVLLDAGDGLLRGAGVTRLARWVTHTSADDIDVPLYAELVREAAGVARWSRAERLTLLLERTERRAAPSTRRRAPTTRS